MDGAGTLLFCARAFGAGTTVAELSLRVDYERELCFQRLWIATFYVYGWRRFMFMDGERVMVMDDGDGELCLGGSSE